MMAKKGKTSTQSANRTKRQSLRRRINFWLDENHPEEGPVYAQVRNLKANRSFAKTVRNGIRLICDLKQGRLDVLFELFPWVKAQFMDDILGSFSQQFEMLIAAQSLKPQAPAAPPDTLSLALLDESDDHTLPMENADIASNLLSAFM